MVFSNNVVIFFSFFTYSLVQGEQSLRILKPVSLAVLKTTELASLVIEVSSDKALVLQLTCENCYKLTSSKFESFHY